MPLVRLFPEPGFFFPGSARLAFSHPWRIPSCFLCQLHLVSVCQMITSAGVMQIFSEIGVGYLVDIYK